MSVLSFIAVEIAEGILSMPRDLYYGSRRTVETMGFMGREVQRENAAEYERIARLIGAVVQGDTSALNRLIETVLGDFFDKVPLEAREQMLAAAAGQGLNHAGRSGATLALVQIVTRGIVNRIVTGFIARELSRMTVGAAVSVILMQGMVERASNASQRLRREHPAMYQKLRAQNLDMLYFLAEEPLKPYMDALKIADTNPAEFQRLLGEIQTHLRR